MSNDTTNRDDQRIVDIREDRPTAAPLSPADLVVRNVASPRVSMGRARKGWYAPASRPAPSTTRQAQILNTTLVAEATGYEGIVIGRDCLSNSVVAHDAFTAYQNKQITSPNVISVGAVGAGKSSLTKTVYVIRPFTFSDRRIVVFDKKDQDGAGEYTELTQTLGGKPLRFALDGSGTRLNLLDPIILAGDGVAGQLRLLVTATELTGAGPLDEAENFALRRAHRQVLHDHGLSSSLVNPQFETTPTLEHLLAALRTFHTTPEFTDLSVSVRDDLHRSGMNVYYRLSELLDTGLTGLFDGPTSTDVNFDRRLTTFDISQLPEDGPAVSLVMAVANVWLLGILKRNKARYKTNVIAEEGWHLVGGPGGRLFHSNQKLARALGLSTVANFHHASDIPKDSTARTVIKEAQTIHIYRQDREEDVADCMTLFNLQEGSRPLLTDLHQGHHLLKISNRREIHVQHVRSAIEERLTNTDNAMMAR